MPSSPNDSSTNSDTGVPLKTNSLDGRSATAKAAAWASRIMTISLGMVVPGLIGYWLDTKLGTKFVLMLAGFALGFTLAIKQLLRLTKKNKQTYSTNPTSRNPTSKAGKEQEP